jgi:hypothetical protein
MKLIFLLAVLFLVVSCDSFTEREMLGTYAPVNYHNTFDTIQLGPQGRYARRVFDQNRRLVLQTSGEWRLKHDVIAFAAPYFFNLDRDLVAFPELLQDTDGNGSGRVEQRQGAVAFCVGYHEGENCYLKVK